jgi:two-component system CheB/CheR fusion protein
MGRNIYELGNHQWDIPELKEQMETILPHNNVLENFEIEQEFPVIGKRKILLDARRIIGKAGETQSILLAIEDVTEHG